MSTVKQIKQLIEDGESLKAVAQGYSELASVKLNKIRSQIERNVSFAQELAGLHLLVRSEAAKRHVMQPQKKQAYVHILLTSNFRFYGGLERSLIHYFLTTTQRLDEASKGIPNLKLVVGKSGASYLQATAYRLPYTPFIFKGDIPSEEEIKSFVNKINNYQTILVYHSVFKSVMVQTPQISDITLTAIKPKQVPVNLQHIFEPEIAQILEFFDKTVVQVSLEQAFLESELARTAARLISMDQAESNANDYIKKQKRSLAVARRSINNIRLLETISTLRNSGPNKL